MLGLASRLHGAGATLGTGPADQGRLEAAGLEQDASCMLESRQIPAVSVSLEHGQVSCQEKKLQL